MANKSKITISRAVKLAIEPGIFGVKEKCKKRNFSEIEEPPVGIEPTTY